MKFKYRIVNNLNLGLSASTLHLTGVVLSCQCYSMHSGFSAMAHTSELWGGAPGLANLSEHRSSSSPSFGCHGAMFFFFFIFKF